MAVGNSTLISDTILFIRDIISSKVTDPVSTARTGKEEFVMTSYPTRPVRYPMITVIHENSRGDRLGMNTEDMVFTMSIEVRVWAKDATSRDVLSDSVINTLRTEQKDADGTVNEELVHLSLAYTTDVNEPGIGGIKSKIMGFSYEHYT